MFGATLPRNRCGSQAGSQRPNLLERYGLLIMVTVGGSAIRVPDGAKPICYLP